MPARVRSQTAAASVEYIALVALVALLALAALAALVVGPSHRDVRLLGGTIARRIACTPKLPHPCRRNPLVLAYGRPLAGLVRALAPAPAARAGLVGVDFRYCRRASCAVAAGPHLTASNRRTTAFTSIDDRRRSGGGVEITYWLYRPTLGWQRIERSAGPGEVAAAARTRLLLSDDPALVPLETLPGRNHYRFRGGEEPPWRWRVPSRFPD